LNHHFTYYFGLHYSCNVRIRYYACIFYCRIISGALARRGVQRGANEASSSGSGVYVLGNAVGLTSILDQ